MHRPTVTCLLVSLLAMAAPSPAAGRLVVFTVNHPLELMAKRIGGEAVEVHFPAPAGVDPADWLPDAETVSAYQGADVILLNGAGDARWLATSTLPRRRLVDTTAAVRDRLITVDDEVTHTHGPTGSHSHGGVAGTTWLDPTLAIAQAHAITDAFVAARPQDEARFRPNLGALEAELGELDRRLAHAAAALDGQPVIFSHPVYQYLERRYGLRGRSVHWEPGEVPDASAWRQLDEMRAGHPATIMIWEKEPAAETLRRLEERGIRVAVFRPSGGGPPDGDFLTEMRLGAERLEQAARPTTPVSGHAAPSTIASSGAWS